MHQNDPQESLAREGGERLEQFRVAICSDRGMVRTNNEDFASYYIPPDPVVRSSLGSLFIVADGIGGRKAGEVASAEAVAALQQEYYFGRLSQNPGKRLEQATGRANFHVFDMSWAMTSAANMGCAMTALLICQNRYYISHVGDTQCYLIRSGHLRKLTTDHHTAADRGGLTRFGQGLFTQRQNVVPTAARSLLSRAIGIEMAVRPEIVEGTTGPGDVFALMTDGLTSHLSPKEVADALPAGPDLQETVDRLVAEGNRRGGSDNLTLMAIALEAGEGSDAR